LEEPIKADSPDKEDLKFRVYLSADRTEVLLDCPNPLSNIDALVVDILKEFEFLELPQTPPPDTLRKIILDSAEPEENLIDHPLIRNTKPIHPIHGTVKWTRNFFEDGWVIDKDTDTIDFREKVAKCSVRRNELLARKAEPEEGTPGVDVFGNSVPVSKAEKANLRCGKGVSEVQQDNLTSYYSDLNGRVSFKDNTLSVDEVFAVHGDIDLKSGNIYHTGSIIVDGDIRDGANVEVDGDILVKGLLEPSCIRCGGDLTVAGGIIGDEDHRIIVGGKIEAKYIRDAHVSAEGNIVVVGQISHSMVRTQSHVLAPRGRIIGGTTIAKKAIRIETAGGPSGTKTLLNVGIDYSLQDRIDVFLGKIGHMEAMLAPVEAALKNAEKSKEEKTSAQTMVVENLSEKRMLIGQSITMEYMQIEELKQDIQIEANPYVVMLKEVWSGTTIDLSQHKVVVKRSISKPRIALLKGTRARIMPLGESNMPPDEV